ncbi:MAG: Pvc16 family protein [Actinomycetota bacterium]
MVTTLLKDRLLARAGVPNISVGRIEPENNAPANRINLFLYEAMFDPSLKNVPLDEGQIPPIWLVLKYLMTAFDSKKDTDSEEAHRHLGKGIRALQELSYLPLTGLSPNDLRALTDNPEPLKITFDETPSELLSRLAQGTEEKYRFSAGFQVRPVMIATRELPSYSLLVGVDYEASKEIGEEGIRIPVIPSMGVQLTGVTPSKFEVDTLLTLAGSDLDLSGLKVMLGPAELTVTARRPDVLRCKVDSNAAGNVISAGSHMLSVVQTLPTGRLRSSNPLIADLIPKLTGALFMSVAGAGVQGTLTLTGVLLGRQSDDVIVALYQNGTVAKTFDDPTVAPGQAQLQVSITAGHAVAAGKYRVILRVNGQQAQASPEVNLS